MFEISIPANGKALPIQNYDKVSQLSEPGRWNSMALYLPPPIKLTLQFTS